MSKIGIPYPFSTSKLKGIQSLPIPFDFTFIIGSQTLRTYKIFACILSPAVLHALNGDATIDEFKIDFNDENHILADLLKIFYGETFFVTEANALDVYIIASQLRNDELIELSTDAMKITLRLDNIFEKIRKAIELNISLKPYIDYIAKHFEEVSLLSELYELPIDVLMQVLKSEKLVVPDNSWLYRWIENIVESQGPKYRVLIEALPFNKMKMNDLCDVFESITDQTLTSEICMKMKSVIMDHFRHPIITVEYKNNDDQLHGIIDKLTKKFDGNVCENELIDVLVPCNNNLAKDLLNYTNRLNSHWKNNSLEGQNWIIFDFKNYTIQLTAYTIRGCYCKDYRCRPKTWIIYGSNDMNNWIELSKVVDCGALDTPYGMMTFQTNRLPIGFRYIKFVQIENHELNLKYIIHLSAFEFFGVLKPGNVA